MERRRSQKLRQPSMMPLMCQLPQQGWISIFGRGFFETGLVKVVLRSSVAPMRHAKTHIIDAVCTRGVVEFVMPILHLFHVACEVNPPHSHKECKHRLLVEISLNGGLNKTSNSMYLDYLFTC